MLLFRSEEHVRVRYERTGATVALEQLWELARLWYADRMSRVWRRRTPEEAEAVFASIGLRGAFWRLTDHGS